MTCQNTFLKMLLPLCCVLLLAAGCTIKKVNAQQIGNQTPSPRQASPRCQQDNKAREIGNRFLFSGKENHYAHHLPDAADNRYERVISDGVFVRHRFDANSVGPIVFRPDGERFAFIAAKSNKKYILEYTVGSETPQIAEPIEKAWNNWVCYGERGKYLFVIAKHKGLWFLDAHPEMPNAAFMRYPLNGDPSSAELIPGRGDGSEGFTYTLESDPAHMEINIWFK